MTAPRLRDRWSLASPQECSGGPPPGTPTARQDDPSRQPSTASRREVRGSGATSQVVAAATLDKRRHGGLASVLVLPKSLLHPRRLLLLAPRLLVRLFVLTRLLRTLQPEAVSSTPPLCRLQCSPGAGRWEGRLPRARGRARYAVRGERLAHRSSHTGPRRDRSQPGRRGVRLPDGAAGPPADDRGPDGIRRSSSGLRCPSSAPPDFCSR